MLERFYFISNAKAQKGTKTIMNYPNNPLIVGTAHRHKNINPFFQNPFTFPHNFDIIIKNRKPGESAWKRNTVQFI